LDFDDFGGVRKQVWGMPIRVSRAEMQMAHRVPCQVSYQNSAVDPRRSNAMSM
jgi:hypothetical protein